MIRADADRQAANDKVRGTKSQAASPPPAAAAPTSGEKRANAPSAGSAGGKRFLGGKHDLHRRRQGMPLWLRIFLPSAGLFGIIALILALLPWLIKRSYNVRPMAFAITSYQVPVPPNAFATEDVDLIRSTRTFTETNRKFDVRNRETKAEFDDLFERLKTDTEPDDTLLVYLAHTA